MSPTKPTEEFANDFHGNTGERQERLRRLVQQSPKDRIADMTQRVNEPSKCEYCGSTWFTEMTFNQYSADAYSAAPGGDIQPISLMPMPIRVCLCGMPMAPNLGGASLGGRTPNESVASFGGSLRVAAAKILERATAKPVLSPEMEKTATKFAERLNVLEKVERVEGLDPEVVLGLQKRITELERETAALHKAATAPVAAAPLAGKVRGKQAVKVPDVPAPPTEKV